MKKATVRVSSRVRTVQYDRMHALTLKRDESHDRFIRRAISHEIARLERCATKAQPDESA